MITRESFLLLGLQNGNDHFRIFAKITCEDKKNAAMSADKFCEKYVSDFLFSENGNYIRASEYVMGATSIFLSEFYEIFESKGKPPVSTTTAKNETIYETEGSFIYC